MCTVGAGNINKGLNTVKIQIHNENDQVTLKNHSNYDPDPTCLIHMNNHIDFNGIL